MKTKILILAGLLCCMSSVICAQTVYVNSSPNATFSAYHTYAWGQQQNPNQVASSFLAQEAQNQINTQLQSKGLRMVQESENPDLIVVGSGGMKTQTSYNAWGMRGIGGGMGGMVLPAGVYVVKDDQVRWVPAVDVTIVVLASLGLVRVLAGALTRRRGSRGRPGRAGLRRR